MNAIEEIRLSSPPADLSAAKRGLLEKRLKGAFKGGVKTNLIPKLPRHDGVALSFAQQRLWFWIKWNPTALFTICRRRFVSAAR